MEVVLLPLSRNEKEEAAVLLIEKAFLRFRIENTMFSLFRY